ncbi:CdaA regulatory protein CdaR [Lachnospiraceae bacterium]|jgi:YbbR domain-containing protein|nr:CdaA regulatory protein CdaR [Lachnospiraceae bacterium]
MLNKIIKWITNNFGLKILAVIFAGVLWLAVVNIDDPVTTRSFTTTVSVENGDYLTGIGKYYEIINNSNTITFKVSGKRSYLERMGNSDFRATADLKMIENLNRVPVEITPQRYGGYVTVASKLYYLDLDVEDLVSKPFVISVQTDGKPSKQHALGETSVSPSLLRVSGPASVVDTIDKAVAAVNVEEMSQDLTDSVIPILYNKDGNEVDTKDLTFNIQNVMVSVRILDTKDVTLNFQTAGTLQEGYEYVGIEYEPQTVSVKGASAVLNTVNSITIPEEVLDLTDATGNIEKEVDISAYLPEGVSLTKSNQAKISVTVKIEKHERRKFELPTANITVGNLGSRYAAEFLTDTVAVELEGLASELDTLDASTLTGSIDVSGMTEGEHTVNLEVNLDSKFKLVKNATVTVDIVTASSIRAVGFQKPGTINSKISDKTAPYL